MKQRLRAVILPALFGLVAPYLWVNALGWLALYSYEDLYLWIWDSLGVKGAVVYHMLSVIETIVFALFFGVALRFLSGPTWRKPVVAFSSGFVSILLVEAIRSGAPHLSTSIVFGFAALLVGTVFVHAALVRWRPT
jgi:multisubunit Na+/H+ antiporter MnhF subunit